MGVVDLAEQKRITEFAAKTAETFVSAYYAATDAPHRVQLIPGLYLPQSTIVWNGHPISGSASLAALLNSMPGTKHEVQGFDCHPLGGGTQNGAFKPPSLLLTVAGVVVHHTPGSLSAMPPSNAPSSVAAKAGGAGGSGSGSGGSKRGGHPADGSDASIPLDALGRAFSQNFVLVPRDTVEGGGIASTHTQDGRAMAGRFYVQADTLRFVG